MTATVIRLADRSIVHRDREIAAHQADLLLAPYRFGLAHMMAGAALWWAMLAHSRFTFGLLNLPANSARVARGGD